MRYLKKKRPKTIEAVERERERERERATLYRIEFLYQNLVCGFYDTC